MIAPTTGGKSESVGDDRDPPLPRRLSQVQDRPRKLGCGDPRRIVGEARDPQGDPHPFPVGRLLASGHLPEGAGGQLGQPIVSFEVHELRGVLGQVHVGRRGAALLQDLVRQHDAVGRAHVDLDVGRARERLDQRGGQLGVLAAVQDERVRGRVTAAPGDRDAENGRDDRDSRRKTDAVSSGGRTTQHGSRLR